MAKLISRVTSKSLKNARNKIKKNLKAKSQAEEFFHPKTQPQRERKK